MFWTLGVFVDLDGVLPRHKQVGSIHPGDLLKARGEPKNIFEKIDRDFANGRFPYMGDVKHFKLVYVTMCSTLHAFSNSVAKPVGSFIVGETSTGKTELMYSVASLIPKNHQINLTTVSSKSLIYHCIENPSYMNGKVLLVEEMSGIKDLDLQYLLRILVTKGEAIHSTIIGGKAVEIEVNGAISLQSTGLPHDNLRDDTMNRLLKLETDDSSEMTSMVIEHIKERYYNDSSANLNDNFTDYHDYFKSIKPFKVAIPFVRDIKFDNSSPDCRRKSKIFLDLLAAVALMNQKKRHINAASTLIAEKEDFHILHDLLKSDMPSKDIKLKPSERNVLTAIHKLDDKNCFTYEDLLALEPGPKNCKPYDKATLRGAMRGLKEKEFVKSFQDGKSSIFSYIFEKANDNFGVLGLKNPDL